MIHATLSYAPPQCNGLTFDLQRFDSIFSDGDGSANNPYQIASVADLQQLATDVNGGNSYSGVYFKLTDNIDLSGSNWTPIGTDWDNSFKGTFDGGGKTISGLTITGTNYYVGLFGFVGSSGTVQNVTLYGANVVSSNTEVAAVAGCNLGTIQNCTVTNSVIIGSDYVGAIVGYNDSGGLVTGNTVSAQVAGQYANVGAVVGYNINEYTYGEYHRDTGTVTNNTFTSNLSEAVGYNETNGGLEGVVSGNTSTGTLDAPTIPDGLFGGGGGSNDSTFSGGDGSQDNPYQIASVEDLQQLATDVNNGNSYSGVYFKLTTDIDLKDVSNWDRIGNYYENSFDGTFDGDGKTISGLTITGTSDYVGLFGFVGTGGTVQNVTLENVNIKGYDYVGGIVGSNNGGTVENCTVSGSVSGTGEKAYVGGVVGYNDGGTVSGNTFSGEVSGTGEGAKVGGIVGFNSSGGTVSDNNNYTGDDLDLIGGSSSGGGEPYIPTGYFVTTESGNVQYVDNDSGKVLFELSGAKDLIAYNVQFTTVGLFAENFDGNEISVVSNDGGYIFYLLDDLSGKTFVANGNNVIVRGNGVTVDVSNGDNVIELVGSYNFNVTGFGAGDVIKLYDEAVQYGFSILGIESDGNGGATINLIDNSESYTITVGGLDVGAGTIGWSFDENTGISTYAVDVTATGAIFAGGKIVYAAEEGTMNLLQLKGANTETLQFYGNQVGLSAENFTGDEISVVSNGGGYTFVLFDDLDDKTFVANGNNVVVYGNGVTVDVSVGNNVIELVGSYNFNVTGFGAGDVIKLYDEMAQDSGVSILGIESDDDGGAIISIGKDNVERYTITVGGLNVGGADTWTFDEETKTAKIVGEAGAALVDGQIVGKAGGTQFEVSGVTTYNDFEIYADEDWKGVALNAAAFTSNIKVESNDGGYDIALLGELNGIDKATFTATDSADNISNYVSGVLIDGGAGDDSIYNWGGATASVKGGAGADKFVYSGGEITITDYVDGTDKIYSEFDYISDEVEVDGNDVVFTTSYPGVLPGDTFSGKIVVKGAANLSELTLYDYEDNAKTYTIPVTNEFNAAGTAVTVGGTAGDFSTYSALYSITASQENSTLIANAKNNTIILEGGGTNILTGGKGNDTFKFSAGGGIVTDYGIGATKGGNGKALTNASGTDIVKVDGKVTGIYFDRGSATKKSATFTATIVYGDDDQVIVLKDIAKKPTTTNSNPAKAVYQTNDVAAATLKIWDTSNTKQAVLSATNLKKLFHDDNDSAFTDIIKDKTDYLINLSENKPNTTNPFGTQLTFTGNNKN